MGELAPDQRNYFYLLEAARVGIHKSILAALYDVHRNPRLSDGEFGLGIAPANRIPASQLDTFPEQVQYAANTVHSVTQQLMADGWQPGDLWNAEQGRYSDSFVLHLAEGYRPPARDAIAGLLESSDGRSLLRAYLDDLRIDYEGSQLPHNLTFLDRALLDLVERVPRAYQSLAHQREALLDAIRIWRNQNTREETIAQLLNRTTFPATQAELDQLDRALLSVVQNMSPNYTGYPHQREALLRLTQLWRRLNTREDAIASLRQTTTPDPQLEVIDPALIALVQRIPSYYSSRSDQRNALLECFRLWRGLDSRRSALLELGVDERLFSTTLQRAQAQAIAQQLDRELIAFIQRVPAAYNEQSAQRESLLRLTQLWRQLDQREAAIRSLLDDMRRMEQPKPSDPPPLPPRPPIPLPRPTRWTPNNIQLSASIIPNGNFTWAEATQGGQRMPPDQATVDAIVRIARLAQQARDRIGRPFHITSWYRPPEINRQVGGAPYSRHVVGDAIDYYVEGMTGDQLYRILDPWWPGGLGRYGGSRSMISHLDARGHRARWRQA